MYTYLLISSLTGNVYGKTTQATNFYLKEWKKTPTIFLNCLLSSNKFMKVLLVWNQKKKNSENKESEIKKMFFPFSVGMGFQGWGCLPGSPSWQCPLFLREEYPRRSWWNIPGSKITTWPTLVACDWCNFKTNFQM